MDAAGRIVIPKRLREAMGATGRTDVELAERDGEIVLSVAPTPMHLTEVDGVAVAVPDGDDLPTLTTEQVREALDGSRR